MAGGCAYIIFALLKAAHHRCISNLTPSLSRPLKDILTPLTANFPLKMLLLDYQNVFIEQLLKDRISGAVPPSAIDQVVSDFDGVTFHISTDKTKTKILISISLRCFQELVKYGAQAVLEREYGPFIVEPESGYDFSVQVDLEQLPADQGMQSGSLDKFMLILSRSQR
jgi:Arp2/3 complex, 34 kD subunit p34-Arc